MPYIKAEDRAPYQKTVKELFSKFRPDDFQDDFRGFVYSLVQAIYGTATNTRYFKQNEMIGVVSSMLLEWHHRTGAALDLTTNKNKKFSAPPNTLAELISSLAERISDSDDATRPGNLNYFLTLCMIEATEKNWLKKSEVAAYMLQILQDLYREITRVYESVAIEKNGEVFPKSLL